MKTILKFYYFFHFVYAQLGDCEYTVPIAVVVPMGCFGPAVGIFGKIFPDLHWIRLTSCQMPAPSYDTLTH